MHRCQTIFNTNSNSRTMPIDRLLLDTHVFLWWRGNDRRLGQAVRQRIATANEIHVSAASAWEVAVKIVLGRLRIPEPFEDGVADSGFSELPILFSHAKEILKLPMHHQDPFDRMLIAQATVEGLTVVTGDRLMHQYDVGIVRV
jgi:PIN domain nuclease of toxin-antitoxin system